MVQINNVGPLPPAADPLRARGSSFIEEVIPQLQQMQADTSTFVQSAKAEVARLLEAWERGAQTSELREQLAGLVTATEAKRDGVKALDRTLIGYRMGFDDDSAALQTAKYELDAQLQALTAMRAHWEEQQQRRGTQLAIENALMWLLPIVKVAAEIASAIQYHNTTEGAMEEAGRKLQEVQQHAGTLQLMCERVTDARARVGDLVQSVQYVGNTLSVICGQLGNQESFLNAAERSATGLYLRAIAAGLDQLADSLA